MWGAQHHISQGHHSAAPCWSPSNTSCFVSFLCSRSTIFLRLHTNGHQELQYLPGDHLGVFPGNHEELVNALIDRLEDAPPANQLVKVELLEERSTALGKHIPSPYREVDTPYSSPVLVLVAPREGRWPQGGIFPSHCIYLDWEHLHLLLPRAIPASFFMVQRKGLKAEQRTQRRGFLVLQTN